MKQKVKLVVVIPVGTISSKNRYEHIADTVASIVHYATPDRRIVIQDNSNPMHLGARLQTEFPELDVVRAPENYGMYGGLYKSLSLAFLHVQATYDFQVLMKMDTDALMTGDGLEDDAIAYFESHPNVGEIGTYCSNGEAIAWPRKRLQYEVSVRGWLQDRKRCAFLRYYLQLALSHGYIPGEHVLGGVSIFRPELIDKLVQGDFLLREDLRRTKLQEDHLWGLFCKVVGMELATFESPEHPLGVVWRGMPCAPQEAVDKGLKAVHSTRSWKDMNEDQIRAFFRGQREAVTQDAPQPVITSPELVEV